MRKAAPVHLITYFPHTEESQTKLARRIAEIHAEAVLRRIQELPCPAEQKMELLEGIVGERKRTAP